MNIKKIKPLDDSFYDKTKKSILNTIIQKNLEGVLITDPNNLFYYTGFFYVTNERPVGLYIDKNYKTKLFIPLLEKENAENIKVDEILIYE